MGRRLRGRTTLRIGKSVSQKQRPYALRRAFCRSPSFLQSPPASSLEASLGGGRATGSLLFDIGRYVHWGSESVSTSVCLDIHRQSIGVDICRKLSISVDDRWSKAVIFWPMSMIGWTPIWSQIVESSLWEEPDYVVKVFLSMLAKKDENFIVRGDVYTIAKYANKRDQMDEVIEAIRVLESPDTKKPLVKQDFDGRRIERVENGWLILNGAKYRAMIKTLKKREYQKDWASNKRKNLPTKGGSMRERLAVQHAENGEE
jgi:hypothetical protein